MSHERDHERLPAIVPPKDPQPLASNPKPDHARPEHPSFEPQEPVDPQDHPTRGTKIRRGWPA